MHVYDRYSKWIEPRIFSIESSGNTELHFRKNLSNLQRFSPPLISPATSDKNVIDKNTSL